MPRRHYSIIALSISKDFQPGNKSTPVFLSHHWESSVHNRVPTVQLKPSLLFLEHDSERCGESEIRGAGQIYGARSGLPGKASEEVLAAGKKKAAQLLNIRGKLVRVYSGVAPYTGFGQLLSGTPIPRQQHEIPSVSYLSCFGIPWQLYALLL